MTGAHPEREDLPVAAAPILAECAPLVAGFAGAGHRLFLVGGLVRDLFGDGSATLDDLDLDFTTDATPPEVKAIVAPLASAVWTQGERFGTIAAKVDGRLVEITTHRAEAYDPESRKPSVVFSDSVLVDLSRRDFTINAVAIELTAAAPGLIDPFDGVADLRARRLRTPLEPAVSFSDDPLRMMRAARFTARLGLTPDDALVDAIAALAGRIGVVSAERVRDEFDKLLSNDEPEAGLDLLARTGLLARIIPEVDIEAPRPWAGVRALAPDPGLRLAALLTDAGAPAAVRRLRELRHSRHVIDRARVLVGLANEYRGHGASWSDHELRALAARAGEYLADLVDLLAAVPGVAEPDTVVALRARLAELGGREDLGDLRPALDGAAVMAELGLEPGPEVGEALAHLLDIRLREGPIGAAEARDRLRRWRERRA